MKRYKELSIIGYQYADSICAHCGTGIKNVVLARDERGAVHHIGTDCATRIGLDAHQIRNRITDEKREEMKRDDAARIAANEAAMRSHAAKIAARRERVAHITARLRAIGGDFYTSLSEQLERGTISAKQSNYVAAAIYGRRVKANAEQYDTLLDVCEFDY